MLKYICEKNDVSFQEVVFMSKFTIVGMGAVGSTIAYSLTITGLASEILMIDVNNDKAMGEAIDIRQGTPFSHPCDIYSGNYSDAVGSDIVVIACGMARKAGQSRLELAQTNVNIAKQVISGIAKYAPDAYYVIVSNPVDIITYTFCKRSGLPESHILGSGTVLDTSRLRSRVAEYYKLNQKNIHAYVMGEHGDSSFINWSCANISGIPIDKFTGALVGSDVRLPKLDHKEVEDYVKKSGATIIAKKGATYYAISMAVCNICRALLAKLHTTLTVSTMMNGEYGISDVCLSVLNAINRNGVSGKVLVPLDDVEIGQLQHSANCLKEVISGLDI